MKTPEKNPPLGADTMGQTEEKPDQVDYVLVVSSLGTYQAAMGGDECEDCCRPGNQDQEGLEKMTCKQRSEGDEGGIHAWMWGGRAGAKVRGQERAKSFYTYLRPAGFPWWLRW